VQLDELCMNHNTQIINSFITAHGCCADRFAPAAVNGSIGRCRTSLRILHVVPMIKK